MSTNEQAEKDKGGGGFRPADNRVICLIYDEAGMPGETSTLSDVLQTNGFVNVFGIPLGDACWRGMAGMESDKFDSLCSRMVGMILDGWEKKYGARAFDDGTMLVLFSLGDVGPVVAGAAKKLAPWTSLICVDSPTGVVNLHHLRGYTRIRIGDLSAEEAAREKGMLPKRNVTMVMEETEKKPGSRWKRLITIKGVLFFIMDRISEYCGPEAGDIPAPELAAYYDELGLTFGCRENREPSLKAFQTAIEKKPGDAKYLYHAGMAHDALGNVGEAIRLWEESARTDPAFADPLYNLGVIRAKEERWEQALECFRKAAELKPDFAKCQFNLGYAYSEFKQYEPARRALLEAVRLEPTWAEAWYKLSMMHGSLKDFEKAIEAARKAVSLAPGHAEAHTYLGMTLGETGHLPESVKAFSEALRIKPGHAMAHYGLGVSRFLMKDFSGAEEEHRILLKMNPTLAQRMERLMGGKKE